jgi:quinol monooxygenase YgiN
MGATERSPRTVREPSQIEVFEGPGAWRRLLLKEHGRVLETKDGKNVLDSTTAFKTVACLNFTLARAKIGCVVLVVGCCADCRRRVSLEAPYHGGREAERTGDTGCSPVTVDQMEKFTPLIPKLVAATKKEPGALQFECNIGDDRKTADFFERYTDSKAALFHQTESFAPFAKEFFAVTKLTRWVIYGTPSDEFTEQS